MFSDPYLLYVVFLGNMFDSSISLCLTSIHSSIGVLYLPLLLYGHYESIDHLDL